MARASRQQDAAFIMLSGLTAHRHNAASTRAPSPTFTAAGAPAHQAKDFAVRSLRRLPNSAEDQDSCGAIDQSPARVQRHQNCARTRQAACGLAILPLKVEPKSSRPKRGHRTSGRTGVRHQTARQMRKRRQDDPKRRRDLGGTAKAMRHSCRCPIQGVAARGAHDTGEFPFVSACGARGWSGRGGGPDDYQRGSPPCPNAASPAAKPASCAGVNPRPSADRFRQVLCRCLRKLSARASAAPRGASRHRVIFSARRRSH